MADQDHRNFRRLVRNLRKQQEAGGLCLKCGESVDGDQISRARFPAFHKGCDGEVAFNIDIGERIRGVLFPSPKPELGPPPGYLAKVLLDVDYGSEAEMFIRRMYGINVRLFDLTGGERREISKDDAVKLVRAFRETGKHGVPDGTVRYRVLSDLASRECEQPGGCGDTKPFCLPCRARHAIDRVVAHEQG